MGQFIVSFLNPIITDCHTEKYDDSPRKGVPCVFPFIYKDMTYLECTNVESEKYWCSAEVDEDGKHVIGSWGYCDKNCKNEGMWLFTVQW